MSRIVLILFASLTFAACSTRIEYERAVARPAAGSIDINTATAQELEKLPHIGRRTAEAIVEFRTENGPFRRAEHLMLIRGVSESRFAEIRDAIRVQ